jgi:hypothetical protein
VKIAELTKGTIIENPATGRRYLILTKAPVCMNYHDGNPEAPTYCIMVRPSTGRAFDLFINQDKLDAGHYVKITREAVTN